MQQSRLSNSSSAVRACELGQLGGYPDARGSQPRCLCFLLVFSRRAGAELHSRLYEATCH